MSRHPKPGGGNPHPAPNDSGSDKETKNRHVYIEPGVKIDFVDDLKKQQKASNEDEASHRNKQLFWTKVASGLLVLAAGLTGWQGWMTRSMVSTAQKTYEASNRPYVGVNSGNLTFFSVDNDTGKPVQTNSPNSHIIGFRLLMEIKNFGTVPGTNYVSDWQVANNGKLISGGKVPSKPTTLFPGQTKYLTGDISGEIYRQITAHESILQINATVHYGGPSASYSECTREQYNPDLHDFMDLGPICEQPWAVAPNSK